MKKILFAMAMAAAAAALSSCEGRDNEGPAYDVDVEAAILGIDYYGEYDSGVGNYCLYLSDKGFHGEDELFYPDAFYYIGDMYGAVSESAQVKLPSGTFSYSYSMYYETGEEAIRIEDSVLKFETGLNLREYLQLKQLEMAKQLLLKGEATPAEVATRLGFPSVQYFSFLFKKMTGVGPGEYRWARN